MMEEFLKNNITQKDKDYILAWIKRYPKAFKRIVKEANEYIELGKKIPLRKIYGNLIMHNKIKNSSKIDVLHHADALTWYLWQNNGKYDELFYIPVDYSDPNTQARVLLRYYIQNYG